MTTASSTPPSQNKFRLGEERRGTLVAKRRRWRKICLAGVACLMMGLVVLLGIGRPAPPSHAQDLMALGKQPSPASAPLTAPDQQEKPITIAYAISLIKCGDHQSTAAGLSDAALVLRHSVHQTSVRNPSSGSKYDYKMYAIVHAQAASCSHVLAEAGFELIVRDVPVKTSEIEGDFLRQNVHREWCCGADEFVKLYAYLIFDAPLVVHVDIDFVMVRPMDDVFDTMLFPADSAPGRAARARLPLERPQDPWPETVNAFMTRDWPQVHPGRKAGYQAGFLVIRPSQAVFDLMVQVIRKGHYVEGFSRSNGWGGLGYGAFVGAMAAQGLWAYVYDVLLPGTWMELNQCRFNHMGMGVQVSDQGKCRNNRPTCEDCRITPVTDIYNIHYTMCRKPWNCIGQGDGHAKRANGLMPESQVHVAHCYELLRIWHDYRTELEDKLLAITGDQSILQGRTGDYLQDVFQGHCTGNGGDHYLTFSERNVSTMQRLKEIYLP